MHFSKVIILFSFMVLPIFTFAQNQPQIKLGTNGTSHGINETGIAEVISIASFTKDGILYITKENKAYIIESFEISILPKGGGRDIIGPFAISSSRGQNNINNLSNMPEIINYLHDGTRIYIEKLIASCLDCTDMNTITVKAFIIRLKE